MTVREEILPIVTIIPERLFFSVLSHPPPLAKSVFYFTVDTVNSFQYLPFNSDFGPHSILQLHKFIKLVEKYLDDHKEQITFYCTPFYATITNSVFLISAFRMVYLSMMPEEALEPLLPFLPKCRAYRDASGQQDSCFDLTIIDVLCGLYRAIDLGWFSMDFDQAEYLSMASMNINWIVPNHILAFPSPVKKPKAELLETFMGLNIVRIVRLCKCLYDESLFSSRFEMSVLNFEDGKPPPPQYVTQFLQLCDKQELMAIHCEAGLGRTGTLIATYLITNFQFSAAEAIGWIRLCRPGSIFGEQQTFLVQYEQSLMVPREIPTPKKLWRKIQVEREPIDPKQIKIDHEPKPRVWAWIEGDETDVSERTISLSNPK